ncbi:MAG: histidine ammonia-lyase [Paludibacter sp. 47-17]|nr:MAG: histidine ammonia-lyase [Paludibacter sp. 47-17]
MRDEKLFREFLYGDDEMTIGIALGIARGNVQGVVSAHARARVNRNRRVVERIVHKQKIVYGINTGFGPLCTTLIDEEDTRKLQYNLLMSHSVGVGRFIDPEIALLMMILKLHALCKGYSGIAIETIERILWHIENRVIPCVPEQGSVGASGDLAPLSHLFLPLIGMGQVWVEGKPMATEVILKQHGLSPVELGPKEGLALINGTQFMSAHAILLLEKLQNCLDHADIIAAINHEAMLGSVKCFDEELHRLRPYAGSTYVAERMRTLLNRSQMVTSHKNCHRVQDPYSLRCIPQIHGASRNAWLHLKEMILTEINSVTDNPIIFTEDKTISGGHFHGQPIALPIDYAGLAAAELGNVSDRRVYLSMMESVPGLPKLLLEHTGLNSGFMILQYSTAALTSENKTLCFPASADSIPTSLGQEDHVSMGSIGVRKSLKIVDNLEKILAIEMLTAAQGFDFRRPLKSGLLVEKAHEVVRRYISFADTDRVFYADIEQAIALLRSREMIAELNATAQIHQINFKNEDHEIFGIY